MNKLIAIALLLLTGGGKLFAQGHQRVPATVQRSFQKDYPEAKDPQWNAGHGQWHANFNDHSRYDRGEMVAHYNQNGRHVDSHIPYDRNDVPAPVLNRAEKTYPGGRDYSYTRIERHGAQPLFQVSLNLGGRNKTVYMDENGRERSYSDHH